MTAIDLYARPSAHYAARHAHALAMLRAAASDHRGRIVQATSLGAEDMVLTDMIARHSLEIAIGTLQTGQLHAETLALIPRIEQRYGLQVEVYEPEHEAVVHFLRQHGDKAMYESIELRKRCCAIRKLEPLSRMLDGREAWITGLRREQSNHRAEVPFRDLDDQGRIKLNPLADWSWNDIWHYIATNDVPYNPLHDQGYPSIGCMPCTRAVRPGEDPRAGRWAHSGKTECGLHIPAPAHAG